MMLGKSLVFAGALLVTASAAQATTLSTLIPGGSLTEGDVVFDNFSFTDFPTFLILGGERFVTADEIDLTTSSTASSVTLTATISPSINLVGEGAFEFYLDFSISVDPPSTREIVSASLGSGDLFATDDAYSQVEYDQDGGLPDLVLTEDTFGPVSQTSDSTGFTPTNTMNWSGWIYGESFSSTSSAGLSTFSLTFNLRETVTPPPDVVPLPAGIWLMLAGLGGLGVLRRAQRG